MAFDTYARVVKDEHVTVPTADPLYTLGSRHDKNGNEYVYIYNAGNSAVAPGQYVVPQGSGGSYTSGYSVTITNASGGNVMGGVAQVTIATGYYGFVMVRGVSLVTPDSGAVSAAAGADLVLGTDGGFVVGTATFATASTQTFFKRFGFTINTMVTAGTGKARIFGSLFT